MRHALFALLSLCSLSAVADDNWKPFPHDQSAYDYSGDKLRQAFDSIEDPHWNSGDTAASIQPDGSAIRPVKKITHSDEML